MDHLPPLSNGAQLLRVPCVCDPTYFDGMEFETFPLRKGFRLIYPHPEDVEFPEFILNSDGSRLTPKDLTPVLQAWLFFGLIIEVLKVSGVSVDIQEFIQREGSDIYVTTKALPRYLAEWERNESSLSMTDRKKHYRRQQKIMMTATCFRLHQLSGQWWEESLVFWVERPEESYTSTLPFSIEISIVILGETLDRASRRARGLQNLSVISGPLKKSLIDQIKACAWCPSEMSLLQEGLDDTSAFFASRLDRPRLKANHSKCSTNKCLAFNITTERYKTHHIADCPGCQFVGVDGQQLASIIGRNQIPRAYLQSPGPNSMAPLKLWVGESGPYVAISHVWSDGMGNANANSLPTCQLLRLHRMACALYGGFGEGHSKIWIDSLLVPVKKGREKRLALSQMCDYYRAAERVLVLDSDLLHASKMCTKEELIARIFLSTWMRRLWTLEEGILSFKNLEFQFCDGTVSMSDLNDQSQFMKSTTGIGEVLHGNMLAFVPELADYYLRPADSSERQRPIMAKLLPALEYRLTTKAVDEPLCIAHIFGLDASRLVVIDDAHLRMVRLLEIFGEHQALFPRRFLFTKEPKLQFDGFRWAPTSFMALDYEDNEYLRDHSDSPYTRLTDKGLLVDGLAGFTLRFGSATFKKVIYTEVDKRIYALNPVPIGTGCRGSERFWTANASDVALNVDPAQCWNPEMQAMLGTSPETVAVLHQHKFGLLVSIQGSVGKASDPDDSLIYARPIGHIHMRELKTANQNYSVAGADSGAIKFTNPDWDFSETEKQMREALEKVHDPETSTFLRCTVIDLSQRWCIG